MSPSKVGTAKWEELSAKKRATLDASFPKEWRVPSELLPPESQNDVTSWPETSGWFTPEELSITNTPAAELIAKTSSGEWKSLDVTKAFCKRAVAAHQLTNCLAETFFDRAIESAKARDEEFARTGKPTGPLHGLPISLKDNFKIKGLDATVGIVSHVDEPAHADSTLAELLESAGAVLYVKTNVPTAMMMAESVNNVMGRTVNPRHRMTTSGGSSGGEASLLVMKGSCMGVGSDIGGSLRIPAACAGLYTIRPSAGRFPVRNTQSGMAGQEAVASVNGPMANTLEDVILYSRSLIETQPWLRDSKCLPIPWREVELPKKLKIGIMWHDGMVHPTPPITRALREVKARLENAGHEIVEWEPIDHDLGNDLLGRMFVADGGKAIEKELLRTGEPWMADMKAYQEAKELGTYDMWQLHLERTDFQNRYLDRWNKANLDAILLPTMAFNTVRNGNFKHVGYTGVYNVLDYSATSFLTGLKVDKEVDQPHATYTPLGDTCKAINEDYDPELMHGLPISLQLVARRLEEEKVLAMTKRVLEVL